MIEDKDKLIETEELDFSQQEQKASNNLDKNKRKGNLKFLFWVAICALPHLICMFSSLVPSAMCVFGLIIFQLIALTRVGEMYNIPTIHLILRLIVQCLQKK